MAMKLETLLKANEPYFHVHLSSTKDLYDDMGDLVTESKGQLQVRYLRGPKCADRSGFFDEAAAALQLPFYFGENWDAFHDCLGDLSGMEATALLIVVTDATSFLEHPHDAFGAFEETITEVASRWAKPSKARDAKSIHVIYHGEPKADKRMQARFSGLMK
jgi:RNAse (barnase) inhibitor barstar